MVAELLNQPSLWIAAGVVLLLIAFVSPVLGSSKKQKQRLERVTKRNKAKVAGQSAALQLRRLRPGEDTHFGQVLATMSSISKLRGRLETAGMNDVSPQKFLSVVVGIMVVVTLLLFLGWQKPLHVCVPVGVLVGLALPHWVVSRKIRKRQLQFLKLFPDAIELMVRGLRAGLPVGESFITVSKELPPPMGDTFGAISQQAQLGVPMEKALQDAATRMALTEFNFFVTTIILQRETGGNLGEILNNLADMLRQRHMMKLKVTALSSEARASAYIVGALPFFVFGVLYVVSPDYLKPLFDDARGNKAVLGALCSLALGSFIMKRMTVFEI